ncbi:hypothetical protein AWC31_14855 [Mycolicibacterium wolinskyi]|uniref:Uncharacterized protein n=1 Tax=Mycolicibacterium wolinskyi TaxID=59750 RepID=A0A1X2FGZ0_9MYCO|nr:hypothetical protein AWC31_14855 [Mycolicibacterium wolinskyi]
MLSDPTIQLYFPGLAEVEEVFFVDDVVEKAVDDLEVPARTAAPWGALVYVEPRPRAMFRLKCSVIVPSR